MVGKNKLACLCLAIFLSLMFGSKQHLLVPLLYWLALWPYSLIAD